MMSILCRGRVAGLRTVVRGVLLALMLLVSPTAFAAVSHDAHLLFDGVNDVATVAATAAPSPTTQLTLEAWIKPRSISETNNQDRVISRQGAYELTISTGDTGCGFGSRGTVQFRATIGGVDARLCGGELTPDAWHHLAGTYDGAQFVLYIDHVRVAAAARTGAIATTSSPLTLGNRPALDRPLDGGLDDVRVWSRALSAAELQNNDRALTGSEANLLAYYRLNETSGQVAFDATAAGRNAGLGTTSSVESSDPSWVQSSPTNSAPIANAGPDQSFAWPASSTSLFGSAQDDGLPTSTLTYRWSLANGPGAVTFGNATALQTSATFSAPGTYLLSLSVSDGELTSVDQIEIRITSAQAMIATLEIRPRFVTLGPAESQSFSVVARDTSGQLVNVTPTWTASAGSITSMGRYTSSTAAGLRTITATAAGKTARATADVKSSATIWPAATWTTATPSSQNMNDALLTQARDFALAYGGSGMIVRGGRQILAWGSQTARYDVKSTTKSIGSTLLGLAMVDGRLAVNDAAQLHLATVGVPPTTNSATGWLDDLTLLHLATHTSGFDKSGAYGSLLFEPGTQFAYSDGAANWMADTLTNVFAADLNAVMFSRVLTPLGLKSTDFVWRSNAYRDDTLNGIKRREFGAGISLNTNAMARLGYLFLRRGSWMGQPLLNEEFIELVQRPAPTNIGKPSRDATNFPQASNHYGVMWWTNADSTLPDVPRDAYWAWGLGDSLLVVIPSLDLVIVRTGSGFGRSTWNANYAVISPFITPIVKAASPKLSVPNVVGRTQSSATTALDQAGLAVSSVTQQVSSTVPNGSVISQAPAAGTAVARNTGVKLIVSRGP